MSPISEGVWIGTLEFEPRTPADLLRLVPLRVLVDDCGEARAVGGAEMGEDQRVVDVRWASSPGESDQLSTLTIELEGADRRSRIQLSMHRESRTWVTVPDAGEPSLRLRLITDSARWPNAAYTRPAR
ncbi:MAG: hypothetical protein IID37_12275 [Planctomycetes bacterium]|nr:hypothetical protein [Planctomycetota bacterium]